MHYNISYRAFHTHMSKHYLQNNIDKLHYIWHYSIQQYIIIRTSSNACSRRQRMILVFFSLSWLLEKLGLEEIPTPPTQSLFRSYTYYYSRQVYRGGCKCGWCRGLKDFTGPQPTDRPVATGKTKACLTARKGPVRYYRGFSLCVLWALWKQIESEICSKLTNAGTGPKKPFLLSLLKK